MRAVHSCNSWFKVRFFKQISTSLKGNDIACHLHVVDGLWKIRVTSSLCPEGAVKNNFSFFTLIFYSIYLSRKIKQEGSPE